MDNMCQFFNYVIRDDVKFETVGSNSLLRATFAASSNRPNKNGLWNKHYFVAFGDVAERLRKCGIKAPCFITLICEQTVYKDKEGKMRENYVISDFTLTPRSKSDNTTSDNEQIPDPEPTPSQPTPANKSNTETLHGLEALEAEFA